MGTLSSQISEERRKLESVVESHRTRIRASNEAIREAEDRLSKLKQLEDLHHQLFLAASAPIPDAEDAAIADLQAYAEAAVQKAGQSKKDLIVGTVERILMDGKRRTTKELLAELSQQGIEVGGADPGNNLAAYLSPQKERFNSDRKRGGWGLNNLPKKGSPDDASPPSGLRLNGASKFPHAA